MNHSEYDVGCTILLLHPPMQQLFACVQVGTNFSLHPAHIPMPYPNTIAHRKNIEGIKESENQKSGSNTQSVQCMQCHPCHLSPVPTWKV